jgi:uracil-DNA glycosylase
MSDALDREERDAAIARARSIAGLRRLAVGCRACHLWARATQTVFGDGPTDARLLVVGEQPGNSEDLEGAPFVGSAGRLLDRALVDAGIERNEVYVTNVVKHFKWRRARTGKKRIHDKPNRGEVEACRPWLDAEVARIGPELIVCLGATAAQAILGTAFRVTRERGVADDPPVGGAARAGRRARRGVRRPGRRPPRGRRVASDFGATAYCSRWRRRTLRRS